MNPQPHPGELVGPQTADHRFHAVVPGRRALRFDPQRRPTAGPARRTPQSSGRGRNSCFSISGVTDVPLRFINVCGLASITVVPVDLAHPTSAFESFRVTRMPLRSASRSTARNPRLCGVSAYSSPGLPKPDHSSRRMLAGLTSCVWLLRLFFSAGAAVFFLLALLDHFGLGGSGGSGSFGSGGAAASARSATTCAITASAGSPASSSRSAATSLARMLWPIISSVTSTVKSFRNLVRQALDFDFARDDFEQSALHLHALRARRAVCTGTVTRMRLVRSMRFRSACSRLPLIGSCCQSTTMTGVFSPPVIAKVENRVVAGRAAAESC